MSDIQATAPPADPPTKAAEPKTPTKPPADATAVFLRVEKYVQSAIADLDGLSDSSSASLRGAMATALAEMQASKPGGVSSL